MRTCMPTLVAAIILLELKNKTQINISRVIINMIHQIQYKIIQLY